MQRIFRRDEFDRKCDESEWTKCWNWMTHKEFERKITKSTLIFSHSSLLRTKLKLRKTNLNPKSLRTWMGKPILCHRSCYFLATIFRQSKAPTSPWIIRPLFGEMSYRYRHTSSTRLSCSSSGTYLMRGRKIFIWSGGNKRRVKII